MGRNCEQCGGTIPDGVPFDLCPRCSLEEAAPENRVGPDIPGYEVVRELGSGGFGTVYECVQLNPAVRCVAVKILSREQESERRRIDDEIQILGDLSHPGIARLLGAGKLEDGRPFYAMELCEGDRFDHWLIEKKPTLRERVKVLRALTEAISHAHQKGVFHRDLTPANVLVTRIPGGEWQPKVIDFGLSRATEGPSRIGREETLEAHWAGTPVWMAPEQLAGEATGYATDLHALGLLLGLSILGDSPLEQTISRDGSWGEWVNARRKWTWPKVPRVPREARPLQWVAEKELSLSPSDRSESADFFGAELTRWLDGKPVRAGKGRTLYEIGRTLAQHPFASTTIALLLLISITASIAWSLGSQSPAVPENQETASETNNQLKAENLQVLSIADLKEGKVETAYQMLQEALRIDPDNKDAQFSIKALNALSPFAKPLADLQLPFIPKSIAASPSGFKVLGFSGEQVLIDSNGMVQPSTGSFPSTTSEWSDPDGKWLATIGKGGRIFFSHHDDGFPVMHPIESGGTEGKISVHPEFKKSAVIGSDRLLRRWDISAIGGTREQVTFESKVPWMGFERGNSNLWLRHQNQEMRGWKKGDEPGFAATLPIFGGGLQTNDIGENHARGIRHGWGPAKMMASLELWRRSGKDRKITAIAGARDIDHLALAANDSTLLWWTPDSSLQAWKTALAPPAVIAINSRGSLVLWCDDQGKSSWLNPVSQTKLASRDLPSRAVAASLLDSDQYESLAVVAGEDGVVRTFIPGEEKPLSMMKTAGDLPGPHRVRLHSLRDHPWYLVGIEGGLTLRVIDAETGNEQGEPIQLDHGLGHFFLSDDGSAIIIVDQRESGSGLLRLVSTKTRRDLIPPLAHPENIIYTVISSDGRHLATSCSDGTVRRWAFE